MTDKSMSIEGLRAAIEALERSALACPCGADDVTAYELLPGGTTRAWCRACLLNAQADMFAQDRGVI